MAIDGKILARAKEKLEEKRKLKEERYERRLEQAYAGAPQIRVIDAEIRQTMADLVGVALGMNNQGSEEIRSRNLELQEQRYMELRRAGFPQGFLDDEYMCSVCSDTGYDGSKICRCLMELYKEEQRKALSSLLKLGDETFDSFDLSYYDDRPSADTGISSRRIMEIIYETCVEYARKFGKKSMNLFFNGAPGLGKTFLSTCIAGV
ncbi:MAG: DNA replication protein DnaC, partial [Oscillospiraceae bacterium]|nr:DNA replication protein DnaC [Oscillospiraceae bacterium]